MLTNEEVIARYYVGYYNRAPDPAGFDFWISNFENGTTTLEIADFFSNQTETDALYPYFADPANNSPEQFIRSIYDNLFNRDPDDAGLEFWIGKLTSGELSTGQMIELIIEGATTNPDLAVVQNKVASAIYWEDQANNFADFAYDAMAASSANAALGGVTDDPATITESQGQSNAFFAGLDGDKTDPGSEVTDDGDEGDKIGIAGPVAASTGEVSILTTDSAPVLNLEAFRSDGRFSGIDGSGQTIVVIDTGIDLDHPAFGPDTDGNGVADRITFSRDFTTERDGTANDIQGHGTNVASIAASSAPGFLGVAPGANIVALQALDANGSGSVTWIEEALQWVVQNAEAMNIVAVNMSLGDSTNINAVMRHPVYGDELNALNNNLGVTTIVAAGNSYADFQQEGASTLSADPNSIAIGAVGGDVQSGADITYFSQRSDDIPTIFAPGGSIVGAAPGGGSSASSGTSQASPHVAGMVALAQQLAQQELGRSLSPDEIATLLRSSGDSFVDDFNANDRVVNTGNTYVRADMFDLGEAILALSDGTAPAPPEPTPGEDIPGTIVTTAQIDVGSTQTSSIGFSGDNDFFEVSLNAGDYEISLKGAPSGQGTLSDPFLTLLSASGAFVTSNDDSGTGLESLIEFSITQDGTYYISAGAYGSAVGTYLLGVESIGGGTGDVGDTTGSASTLSPGASVSSDIGFGADRDWYAIDLSDGQTYTFDLVGDTLGDPYLYLYDQNGFIVAADDDSGSGLNSSLVFDSAGRAGTYYLSAEAFSTGATGTYTLTASGQANNGDDFSDTSDTSGVLAAANGSATGTLEEAGDRDWFRVDLNAGTNYDFALSGSGSGASLSDPYLYLYDTFGNLLGSNDDGGNGLNSLLNYTANETQSYFVAAAAYGDGSSGEYVLTSTQIGGDGGDVAGDTSTTATLSVGQTILGTLDELGDADWYGVNIIAGQTYSVSMTSAGPSPMQDPYLTLLDSQGNFVLFNDDTNGRDAMINFEALQSTRVFVAAEAYDGFTDTGTYELSLELTFANQFSSVSDYDTLL